MLTIYCDGACAGNPGNMGVGYVVLDKDMILYSKSCDLGLEGTNNEAEYRALIAALEMVLVFCGDDAIQEEVEIYSDSKLVVSQINGVWAINHQHLQQFCLQANRLRMRFKSCTVSHVPRTHPWIVEVDRNLRELMNERKTKNW